MMFHCNLDIVLVQFLLCLQYILFSLYRACSWSIIFLKVVNPSKLHYLFESYNSTFHVHNFLILFPYKFLVLKVQTAFSMQNM
jgi:hypothetical protein